MSEIVDNGVKIYQFPVEDETVSELNKAANVRTNCDVIVIENKPWSFQYWELTMWCHQYHLKAVICWNSWSSLRNKIELPQKIVLYIELTHFVPYSIVFIMLIVLQADSIAQEDILKFGKSLLADPTHS